MQQTIISRPLTVNCVIKQISEQNENHQYWSRRFAGRTAIHNMRHRSLAREKDFFSEKTIINSFAIFILSSLMRFPTLYLERYPGEMGQGPIFTLMHYRPGEPDAVITKFQKDKLSPLMADEMQKFFESPCNKDKTKN